MAERLDVLIPWRGGDPHRERALEHVLRTIRHPVRLGAGSAGTWVKADAVRAALERSTAPIVAIQDADVVVDLEAALEAVEAGAPWAVPHALVHRLTAEGTRNYLQGAESRTQAHDQPPYRGVAGGGAVVIHRALIEGVPLDPRFRGWGQEDEAWGLALRALYGAPWRGTEPLIHLWHPPQPRLNRKKGSSQGWQLRERYRRARRHPEQIRALLGEIRGPVRAPNALRAPPEG